MAALSQNDPLRVNSKDQLDLRIHPCEVLCHEHPAPLSRPAPVAIINPQMPHLSPCMVIPPYTWPHEVTPDYHPASVPTQERVNKINRPLADSASVCRLARQACNRPFTRHKEPLGIGSARYNWKIRNIRDTRKSLSNFTVVRNIVIH